MANWAKLQEDLVGKSVFKRAKHGIHFKNNDGSITANFSGKPCHYLDAGLWKPIDTKLVLLPDGFYGCPHSPVKVHPDGRVAVTGTSYQQRAELPSAKTGLADNDRMIRQFSFGSQELRITEDGFRSEITLNRIPTLSEARKLIASESGTLSKEYLKSLTTATDANGDVHTFTTLTAFRTWLAKAVFPVIIDPDISVNTGVGGDVYFRSGTNGVVNYGTVATIVSYQGATDRVFLIRFDLSSIDSAALCTAAIIKLTLQTNSEDNTEPFVFYKISDANGDWVEGTTATPANTNEPCWNAKKADGSGGVTTAWAGSAGLQTAGTDYINTVLASETLDALANAQIEFDMNADGLAVIQSWFGDATNNGLLGYTDATIAHIFHSGESATEGYRPVLTVTYTAAGGVYVPTINMVGNMQNLNGLRG